MAAPAEAKFRVTLTQSQLAYLRALLANEMPALPLTAQSYDELLAYLDITLVKIHHGVASVSHTATPKQTIADQLGESAEDNTPGAIRNRCYVKYQASPKACTPQEILQAKTFMYENNMMSGTEEEEFENSVVTIAS